MKKILVLLTCGFMFSMAPLYASIYTVTTNIDASDEEESKITNVVAEKDLLEGITFQEQKEIVLGNDQFYVRKITTININEFVVVGDADNGKRPYQAIDRFSFPFIIYIKNNQIVFLKILDENGYGMFNDVCKTINGFSAIGYLEKTPIDKDILCCCFSLEGEILNKKIIAGTNDDIGIAINYQDDYLYFMGTTLSNDGDFKKFSTSKIFTGIIGYKDFSLLGINSILEKGINYRNVLYDDQYTYMSLVNDYIYTIVKYTIEGIAENYYTFTEPIKRNMILTHIDKELYFYQEYSSDDKIIVYKINNEMNDSSKKTISFNKKYYKTCSVFLVNDHENIIAIASMTSIKNSQDKIKVWQILDKNFEVIKQFEEKINDEEIIMNCKVYDEIITSLSVIQKNNLYYVKTDNVSFIQAISVKEDNETYCHEGYKLKINTREVRLSPMKNIDIEKYQTIKTFDSYKTNTLNVFIPATYECKAIMNVIDGKEYDLGLKLEFNGLALLNGKEIEPNYIIDSCGFYTLKLTNNEGENTICGFTVGDLSLPLNDNVNEIETNLKLINQYEEEKLEYKKIDLQVTNESENSSYGILVLIIVITLVLGFITGLIITKIIKRKWRDNV